MVLPIVAQLLAFYGLFLFVCGIASVLLIGFQAKTALASGGLSGSVSLLLAYLVFGGSAWAYMGGIGLAICLFGVFSWRSAKTLFKIFEMLRSESTPDEVNKKGIAFLIISLMAVVSLFVLVWQIILT